MPGSAWKLPVKLKLFGASLNFSKVFHILFSKISKIYTVCLNTSEKSKYRDAFKSNFKDTKSNFSHHSHLTTKMYVTSRNGNFLPDQ